ncbi:substrate-binding domain-containing protein, partial [Chromobacterium sp. S0633]
AEAAQQAVSAWLTEAEAPRALVISNGLLLLGAMRAVRALGLALPRQLALAGFDNDSWTELAGPGLTVIEQPVDEIGRAAMAMLLERLEQPQRPTRKVVLTGRLVVRGSSLAEG